MKAGSRGESVDRRVPPLAALNPLFASKTRPPVLPRPHLSRTHLLGLLKQSARRRVCLVCAPAGAGKTTLLADFVRPIVRSTLWYTVDDLDDSADAFLHGLSLALGNDGSKSSHRLGYLAQIVESLNRTTDQRVIVIDDVHRLTDLSAARALSDLIRYLPPSARLILVGRSPPCGIERILDWLATQNHLTRLTWEYFQLSEAERAQASNVFKSASSGGWILSWAHPDSLDLARYLRSEVLEPLGASNVETLARMSVLPSFDARLAAAAAGVTEADAGRLLRRVVSETPLIEMSNVDTYRFSETARAVLNDSLSDRETAAARHAAGSALRELDPFRSAECFLAAGDRLEAARSLARLPLVEWMTQASNAPHDLLKQLSFDDVRNQPELILAKAWAMLVWGDETDAAEGVLTSLVSHLEDPRLRFWSLYALSRARIALGHTDSARSSFESMRLLLDEIRQDSWSDPSATVAMLGRAAMVEWYLDDPSQAICTAERGLAIAELSSSTTRAQRLLLHHVLGTFMVWQGDYSAADQHFGAALALSDTPADVAQRATIWNAQAGVARCRGEFIRTLSFLEQSLREPFIPPREQMLLNLQAAHALADVQDFRGAAKRYRLIAGALRGDDRDSTLSRALAGLATCCSFLGLMAEAQAALDRLGRLHSNASTYDRLLAQGIFALRSSDPSDAAEKFRRAREVQGTVGGIQDTWQAVLLEAQALACQGRAAEAEEAIDAFLASHPGRPMPAVGLWVLQPVQTYLVSASRRHPDAGLAVLHKLAAADPSAPRLLHAVAAIDQATDVGHLIEIRLFGPPRLLIDGQEAEWPYGLRHKAIELFWYAALHPDGFTRDQTLADLFPDRDQTSGLKLLQVTVSNLRAALTTLLGVPGDSVLCRASNGMFRLRTDSLRREIAVETRMLATLSEQIRDRHARVPSTVPDLFRGELLSGLNAEWIEPIRRYWMAVYLRTLGTLADRYARNGILQQAIRCRELALQVDPTIESAHADLMRLYHAAGDREAVESQMWLYTRVARDELDAEPNEDVEELYRELLGSSTSTG